MSYYALNGLGSLGAIDFNADNVWADWKLGGDKAGTPEGNAAGKRAAQKIQAALNELGYGPIDVDGQFGPKSIAAWNKFAAVASVATGWPNQQGITALSVALANGASGPGPKVSYTVVDGQYVKTADGGTAKAGMLMGLGALALAAIAGFALFGKKKRGVQSTALAVR